MSRPMGAATVAALVAASKRPALFYQGNFTSGDVFMWSGIGPYSWNGQTWVGAGNLAKVTTVGETTDVVAQGVVFTVSGVPPDLVSLIEGEVAHGQKAFLWLGFLDPTHATNDLVDTPLLLFSGSLDVPTIIETADGPTIEISYENRLIDLDRARLFSYVAADQGLFFPGDRGFDFVPSLQQWASKWGST